MLKTTVYSLILLLSCSVTSLFALPLQHENQPIEKIQIEGCNLPEGSTIDAAGIRTRMKTREGDVFSQTEFDTDLKMLVLEYDKVEPSITTVDDKLIISLKIWTRPIIRSIKWHGNHHIKATKLQKELEVATCTVFDRQAFNRAFHKLKTYYVKQGYFEAVLDYDITFDPLTNNVDIQINICEGRAGRVKKILFVDFTKDEEEEILDLIVTKRYCFLTSWYNGEGTFNEEAMQQDRFTILNFLQNKGYADAIVDIDVREACQNDRIIITISAERGQPYYFGAINFEGNTLFCDDDISAQIIFSEGDLYSPEIIRDTVKKISDFYGRRGYIDAIVDYEPRLDCESRTYSIHFTIEEGKCYRVGLVKVFGNCSTQTNVILHESLLIPGEVFNIIKLELTEERLQNIGYFKNVNVYAVKSEGPGGLGGHYRDVHIEVEETMTGSFGAGFGLSSAESVFGEFNITERNFNYKGLGCFWKEGLGRLRGGGEYLHLNAMIGAKSRKYGMSWTKPFFQDTPWVVGFEIDQSNNRYISQDYEINAFNISPHGSYPLNQYLRLGVHYRWTNTYIDLNGKKVRNAELKDQAEQAGALAENNQSKAGHYAHKERKLTGALAEESKNSGLISAFGMNLNYDSTNHPSCPTRGF
ncbi:MAG: outer membrane protein assembly factor BamA, partial [Parachlamydiaceae bacterium]